MFAFQLMIVLVLKVFISLSLSCPFIIYIFCSLERFSSQLLHGAGLSKNDFEMAKAMDEFSGDCE